MVATNSLRQAHPNFWLVTMGHVFVLAWFGAGYAFIGQTSPSFRVVASVAPIRTWGWIFLAAAACIAVGNRWSPMLFRTGLAAGAALNVLFALGFLATAIEDYADTGEVRGSGAPGAFAFIAVVFVAGAREPRSNPDAVR